MIARLGELAGCAWALGRGPGEKWEIFWRQTKNLRTRFHLSDYHPEEVFALDTRFGRLHFRDNFGDVTNLLDLFYREVYRARPLAPEGVILDAGANIGLAAAWLAHEHPGRKIHCYEPLAANTALIPLNCPGADVVRVALGASRGRATLRVDRHAAMATSIPTAWETREEEFEVAPLDELAAGLGPVAFLKIDAEGMETEILRGAVRTLARTDQVVLETHSRARHDESMELLRKAGLSVDRESFDGKTGMVYAARGR